VQSPLSVTWEQLELSASKVRLLAHVKRLAPINAPMTVKFEVPPMARMTLGRTSFEVQANSAADELTEPIELTYSQLPVQDLVARVTASGAGGGVNYAVPYRFGRTAATAASPKIDGPAVIFNGRPMGQSISLDAKPTTSP
jgi:hypothetical protein